MGRQLERTIIRPTHAAYGLPSVTGAALMVSACIMAGGYFLPALGLFALLHGISISLRARIPHGENLLWRLLTKRKTRHDWSNGRRAYHA